MKLKVLYAVTVAALAYWLWDDGDKRGACVLLVTAGVAVLLPQI